MSWKIITIQSIIVIGCGYLAIQYFAFNQLNELQFQQVELTSEIHALRDRLNSIEQQVNSVSRTQHNRRTLQVNDHNGGLLLAESKIEKEQAIKLYQRIQALEEKEKYLQEAVTSLTSKQEALRRTKKQPEHVMIKYWLADLPDEKRAQVQDIYREQLALMQSTISTSPDSPPPSEEDMMSILQENREGLKVKLKDILTHDEYQTFLQSLDRTGLPPGLPPINQ